MDENFVPTLAALLAFLAGPSFAVAWALIASDLARNADGKYAWWKSLEPSIKQLIVVAATVAVPYAVSALVMQVPLETIAKGDAYFYPIAVIVGKLYFAYRKAQPQQDQQPSNKKLDDLLMKDLFGGASLDDGITPVGSVGSGQREAGSVDSLPG